MPSGNHLGKSNCTGECYGSRGTMKYPVPRVALGKPSLEFWGIPVYVYISIYLSICLICLCKFVC